MREFYIALIALTIGGLSLPSYAQQKATAPAKPAAPVNQAPHQIQPDWNKAREFTINAPGTISWDLLQQAEMMDLNTAGKPRVSHIGEPGKGGVFGNAPEPDEPAKFEVVFGKEVQKLNGKKVKVAGFMLPLQQTEKHTRFLLAAVPPSCPFCLPGGPNSTIEVFCKDPIAFAQDGMVLSGTMNLLKDDPTGFYYRLTDATETK